MNSKLLQRICYACGTFGHDVFYAMIGTYFMIFVTSNLFHSDNPSHDAYMIGIVTTIILVLRILELFVDPFIGNLIDKSRVGAVLNHGSSSVRSSQPSRWHYCSRTSAA